MQINHLANFYHVCNCLKSLLLHFSLEILLCFFLCMAYWKRLAFAKWDKCMEGSSLTVNSFFQEACQIQWHELDWSRQQFG